MPPARTFGNQTLDADFHGLADEPAPVEDVRELVARHDLVKRARVRAAVRRAREPIHGARHATGEDERGPVREEADALLQGRRSHDRSSIVRS
jgi:hypothetical protein